MKALALAALAASQPLPAEQLEIALRVAGPGLPHCRSTLADGSEAPCLPAFALRPGGTVNGWSLGPRIHFSQAATRRLNRNEFALLAGHEIAHWYLGHQASTPETERAADRFGAQLACQAGFDPVAGASLFGHLRPSRRHPPAAERRVVVLAMGCEGEEAVVAMADEGGVWGMLRLLP